MSWATIYKAGNPAGFVGLGVVTLVVNGVLALGGALSLVLRGEPLGLAFAGVGVPGFVFGLLMTFSAVRVRVDAERRVVGTQWSVIVPLLSREVALRGGERLVLRNVPFRVSGPEGPSARVNEFFLLHVEDDSQASLLFRDSRLERVEECASRLTERLGLPLLDRRRDVHEMLADLRAGTPIHPDRPGAADDPERRAKAWRFVLLLLAGVLLYAAAIVVAALAMSS